MSENQPGIGVDSKGGAVIDPTKNVEDTVNAAVKRLDDLRIESERYVISEVAHVKEIGDLRSKFQEKIDAKEADRLDKVRQIDEQNRASAANQLSIAVQTLATTAARTEETLRKQVADTALVQETKFNTSVGEIREKLRSLELAISEGKGKQLVSDPALERLAIQVEKVAQNGQRSGGVKEGLSQGWAILIGAVGLIATLLYIANALRPAVGN